MAKPIEYNPSEVLVADFVTVLAPKTGTFAPPPKGAVGKFKADDSTTYPDGWAPIGLTSCGDPAHLSSRRRRATVIDTAEVAAVRTSVVTSPPSSSHSAHLQQACSPADSGR